MRGRRGHAHHTFARGGGFISFGLADSSNLGVRVALSAPVFPFFTSSRVATGVVLAEGSGLRVSVAFPAALPPFVVFSSLIFVFAPCFGAPQTWVCLPFCFRLLLFLNVPTTRSIGTCREATALAACDSAAATARAATTAAPAGVASAFTASAAV